MLTQEQEFQIPNGIDSGNTIPVGLSVDQHIKSPELSQGAEFDPGLIDIANEIMAARDRVINSTNQSRGRLLGVVLYFLRVR